MSAVTARGLLNLTEISFNIPLPRFQEHRSTNFTHIKALDLLVNLEKTRDSASASPLKDKGRRYLSLIEPESDAIDTGSLAGITFAVMQTAAIIFKPSAALAAAKAIGVVSFTVGLPITIGVVVGVAAYYFYSKQLVNSKAELENYLNTNKETLKELLTADIVVKQTKVQEIVGTFAENVAKTPAESFKNAAKAIEEAEFAQEVLDKFFTEPVVADEETA